MSEEDLCELLKFDRKMLRQRINTLKADKLLQARMKMVTLDDGKAQREQYYFINYKSFVNVVKYKLDHIRKKLEMEERDQTSRASFICNNCQRTYTDLEAGQLLNMETGELHCIICHSEVQEDMSGMPRHDTRILLSRFNEQMEPLFTLLKEVENVKLSAEFSEPKPQDFSNVKRPGQNRNDKKDQDIGSAWSGDATRKQGFQVEGSIDVNIKAENGVEETIQAKEKPIWLTEATSFITTNITSTDQSKNVEDQLSAKIGDGPLSENQSSSVDVLSLLQEHERKPKRNRGSDSESDGSSDDQPRKVSSNSLQTPLSMPSDLGNLGPSSNSNGIEEITISDDDDVDSSTPMISVGLEKYPITDIDNEITARMTQDEKNFYITAYQEYFGGMED